MTRTVVARFPDGETARRAAVALGRTELAAGPTRVRVPASGPDRSVRLELRVEEPDVARAMALLRERGAEVTSRDERDSDADPRSRGAAGGSAPAIWGNAPRRPDSRAGTGSGAHMSETDAAGSASNMGQTGPGTTPAAGMGATDPRADDDRSDDAVPDGGRIIGDGRSGAPRGPT